MSKEYVIKDSGQRQEFDTGSRRDIQENKGRFDLLPGDALQELSVHFEKGAAKYGDRNWELGQPISRYMSSGLRHAFQYLLGKNDENHLAAAAWNFICAMATRQRVALGILPMAMDDIPTTYSARAENSSPKGVE